KSGPQSQLPRPVDGNRRWHVVNGETVSLATIGGEEISAILRQEPADLNSSFSPRDRERSRPVSVRDHRTFLGAGENNEARFQRLERNGNFRNGCPPMLALRVLKNERFFRRCRFRIPSLRDLMTHRELNSQLLRIPG